MPTWRILQSFSSTSWQSTTSRSKRVIITDLNFRLSAGVYHQAPFYKELRTEQTDALGNNYVALNKDIKAQRSLHAVFGMDYFFRAWNRPFKLTLEAYYKPSDRVISYYVDNVRVRYSGENDAVAYTTGVDVKLFGEFVCDDKILKKYTKRKHFNDYLKTKEAGETLSPATAKAIALAFFAGIFMIRSVTSSTHIGATEIMKSNIFIKS